jgi:hypothetical protein
LFLYQVLSCAEGESHRDRLECEKQRLIPFFTRADDPRVYPYVAFPCQSQPYTVDGAR